MSSSEEEDDDGRRMGLGRRRKNVASAMLGVFGEDDDEVYRRKVRRADAGAERPVAFVSASSSTETKRVFPREKEKKIKQDQEMTKAPEWERHTKGIGFALLQKMGYTGKTGKDEKIVAKPIEVKQRPDGMGLGFGSIDKKKVSSESQETKRAKKNRYKVVQHRQLLQKAAQEAAESLAVAENSTMTLESKELRTGRRLLEALDAALNGEAAAEREALQRCHAEMERSQVLKAEVKRSIDEARRLEMEADRLRRFLAEIESLQIKATGATMAKEALERWRLHYPRELALTGADSFGYWHNLEAVLRAQLEQSADVLNECISLLEAWQRVFPDDMRGFADVSLALVDSTQSIRRALSDPHLFAKPASRAAARHLCLLLQSFSATPAIISAVLVPRLMKWLEQNDDDLEASFAVLEWLPLISSQKTENPQDYQQCHDCVIKALEALKRKVGQISSSGPFDRAASSSLLRLGLAWREALSDAHLYQSWKKFVLHSIPWALAKALDPRLLRSLGLGFGLPDASADLLLQDELGPRFLEAMRRLLSGGRRILALALYLDWRQAVIGEDQGLPALGDKARLTADLALRKALDLIELAARGDVDFSAFDPHLKKNHSSERRNSRFDMEDDDLVQPARDYDDLLFKTKVTSNASDHYASVSFLDVVARFAQDHDLVFAPKLGRSHDGKQVYTFGDKASIYIDKDVTFLSDPTTRTWIPVSLEDLLLLQQQQQWR